MTLCVLLSTMNQKDYNLLKSMNINCNSVVVNQIGFNSINYINKINSKSKWLNSNTLGLSKSRNIALNNSFCEISIFADDDIEYISNFEEVVVSEFKRNPKSDIIIFQVEGIERTFKKYPLYKRKIGYLRSLKISSVEIAFRTKKIIDSNIKFNEKFGAGSMFQNGEENIFLFNCLRKGLKITYVPRKIANIHVGNSSWFKGFTKKYFEDKAALFTEMSRMFSLFFIFQFAIRKFNFYKNDFSFFSVITFMLKARYNYLNSN